MLFKRVDSRRLWIYIWPAARPNQRKEPSMLSRRLTLGIGAALLAGAVALPATAADLDTVTLDWAYYNPVSLVLKKEGWLEEALEAGRDPGPVGAEPGLEQGARVPQRRQPGLRLDRGGRGPAGQGQRQPDRDRLDLLQAGMDGAGHPPRHRHRQGRGPEGQAHRGHQGHRPLHLPAARAGASTASAPATSSWSCCSTTRAAPRWSAAMSTPGPASTR